MSQPLGKDFKTRVPTFSDDASIQEAFSVYHYGVDNYTSQPIPSDSIEGHFQALNDRVAATEGSIDGLGETFIEEISGAASPNVITAGTNEVIPLTIRGVQNQLSELQKWVNNNTDVVKFYPSGAASFNSYLRIGNVDQSTTTGLVISLADSTHKGIQVRAATSPTANLQEWTNSTGSSIFARVDAQGRLYSENVEVVTLTKTQTLTNKTLTSPILNNADINNSVIENTTIDGSVISNAVSIRLSGAQALSARARNITLSTGNPSGGSDGDIWIKYVN